MATQILSKTSKPQLFFWKKRTKDNIQTISIVWKTPSRRAVTNLREKLLQPLLESFLKKRFKMFQGEMRAMKWFFAGKPMGASFSGIW